MRSPFSQHEDFFILPYLMKDIIRDLFITHGIINQRIGKHLPDFKMRNFREISGPQLGKLPNSCRFAIRKDLDPLE